MNIETRIKEPQQDRSRKSLEKVLKAGLEILLAEGWHNLTLAAVCERAGVSVGMLYRRFKGRDQLLQELKNRWIRDAIATADDLCQRPYKWENMSPQTTLYTAIRILSEGFRNNESETRMFGLYGVLDNQEINDLQKVSMAYSNWFRGAISHHLKSITHSNPEKAIDFCYRLLLDTMVRRTTHGDEFATGAPIGDWDEFELEMSVICERYLFLK